MTSTCPRCDTALADEGYEGVLVRSCRGCGGYWLGRDQLREIIDRRDQSWESEALEAWREMPPRRVPLDRQREDLTCPDCRQVMEPFNYAGDTGILLDRCQRCGGVWLDGGELDKVQMAVEASEQALEADRKRNVGRLRDVELYEDHLEQKDNRVTRMPLISAIVDRFLGPP